MATGRFFIKFFSHFIRFFSFIHFYFFLFLFSSFRVILLLDFNFPVLYHRFLHFTMISHYRRFSVLNCSFHTRKFTTNHIDCCYCCCVFWLLSIFHFSFFSTFHFHFSPFSTNEKCSRVARLLVLHGDWIVLLRAIMKLFHLLILSIHISLHYHLTMHDYDYISAS